MASGGKREAVPAGSAGSPRTAAASVKAAGGARLPQVRKTWLLMMLTLIFCCAFVVSNVLAAKTLAVGGFSVPASIILYPIVFIVNDCLAELFGLKETRKVILYGVIVLVTASLFLYLTVLLPGLDQGVSDAFALLFSSTWRVLLASLVSYWVGAMLNARIMVAMKRWRPRQLFARCITSTIVGETVDSAIFLTIAFAGVLGTDVLLGAIAAQSILKVLYEIVLYPLTRTVILRCRVVIEAAEGHERGRDGDI